MSYRSSPSFAIGGLGNWDGGPYLKVPPWGWSCFHCGEHFPATWKGQRDAQRHFGLTPKEVVACEAVKS